MAAVHNGFGIAVVASGQLLDRVTPGSSWWDGHPSSAAINVAYVADSAVDSIVFRARRDTPAPSPGTARPQAVPVPITSRGTAP